jgi:hypothetical protein
MVPVAITFAARIEPSQEKIAVSEREREREREREGDLYGAIF